MHTAEHVKFFVTELDNGDVGFADLTIHKLREVCSGLCRSIVSGILFQFVPFLACVTVILDRVTGFKSPDKSALQLCSRVRYPSRTERKHVRGVGTTSFLYLNARVGVTYSIMRENLI